MADTPDIPPTGFFSFGGKIYRGRPLDDTVPQAQADQERKTQEAVLDDPHIKAPRSADNGWQPPPLPNEKYGLPPDYNIPHTTSYGFQGPHPLVQFAHRILQHFGYQVT